MSRFESVWKERRGEVVIVWRCVVVVVRVSNIILHFFIFFILFPFPFPFVTPFNDRQTDSVISKTGERKQIIFVKFSLFLFFIFIEVCYGDMTYYNICVFYVAL